MKLIYVQISGCWSSPCCCAACCIRWCSGGLGKTFFHDKAQGSLLPTRKGKPIGSRLIAQPFTADEYFQPRPSAASYNAARLGVLRTGPPATTCSAIAWPGNSARS